MNTVSRAVACGALAALAAGAAAEPGERVDVEFVVTRTVGAQSSVFVLGDLPELGGGDIRPRAEADGGGLPRVAADGEPAGGARLRVHVLRAQRRPGRPRAAEQRRRVRGPVPGRDGAAVAGAGREDDRLRDGPGGAGAVVPPAGYRVGRVRARRAVRRRARAPGGRHALGGAGDRRRGPGDRVLRRERGRAGGACRPRARSRRRSTSSSRGTSASSRTRRARASPRRAATTAPGASTTRSSRRSCSSRSPTACCCPGATTCTRAARTPSSTCTTGRMCSRRTWGTSVRGTRT